MIRNYIILICFLLAHNSLKAINKEVVINTTSLFMLQSNSVLESYTQSKNLYNEGKYAESLKIALKTLDLAKKEKDTKYIILANHLISKILYTNKNLENSLKYYKETLSLIKKYKNNILREANDSVIYDYNLIKSEAILGKSTEEILKYGVGREAKLYTGS